MIPPSDPSVPRDDRVDHVSVEAAAPGETPFPAGTLAEEKALHGWQKPDMPSGAPVLPKETAGTRGAVTETGR